MRVIPILCSLSFAVWACKPTFTFALTLPNAVCNITQNARDLESRRGIFAASDKNCGLEQFENITLPNHLPNPSNPNRDPFRYRIPGGLKSIYFFNPGEELTRFDDVFDLIQMVLEELEQEPQPTKKIPPSSSWTYESASFKLENPLRLLDYRQALRFLWGLQQSGFELGFWEGYMAFYDTAMTETRRGTGFLGPPVNG